MDEFELDIILDKTQFLLDVTIETNVSANIIDDMMSVIAGENISSSNVIMLVNGEAFKYQPGDVANYGKAIGIAGNAAIIGNVVNVKMSGKVNIPGWGLSADQLYYAADNGGVTTNVPLSGLHTLIGIAKDPDNMIVDIDEPIIL